MEFLRKKDCDSVVKLLFNILYISGNRDKMIELIF